MEEAAHLSCKEAARLMSRQRDEALSAEDQDVLRGHLHICLSCRRFEVQLDFLRRLARKYGERGPPPEDEPV